MSDQADLSVLFEAAIAISSREDRDAFIDTSCKGNKSLLEQLRVLVKAHDKAGRFLSALPPELAATQMEVTEASSASASPHVESQCFGTHSKFDRSPAVECGA